MFDTERSPTTSPRRISRSSCERPRRAHTAHNTTRQLVLHRPSAVTTAPHIRRVGAGGWILMKRVAREEDDAPGRGSLRARDGAAAAPRSSSQSRSRGTHS